MPLPLPLQSFTVSVLGLRSQPVRYSNAASALKVYDATGSRLQLGRAGEHTPNLCLLARSRFLGALSSTFTLGIYLLLR